MNKIWLRKLVNQHRQTLIPLLSSALSSFWCFLRKRGSRSLEVCPFWATVVAHDGGPVEVDPLPTYVDIRGLSL